MLSSPARYIQPAEPVYQVQPARPMWSGWEQTSPASTYGSPRYRSTSAARARVVHRVQHVEELGRLVPAPQLRERHHDPGGGVRVLAAVLPDARGVAPDVAGILRGAVEGRREEQDDPGPAADEVGADRVHGPVGEPRRRGPGEHRPRLGDRVDPALLVLRRAERRAVVVVASQVPLPVPGPREDARQALGLAPVAVGACPVPAAPRRPARSRSGPRAGRTRARRSLPSPLARPGSSRRSSRRSP